MQEAEWNWRNKHRDPLVSVEHVMSTYQHAVKEARDLNGLEIAPLKPINSVIGPLFRQPLKSSPEKCEGH